MRLVIAGLNNPFFFLVVQVYQYSLASAETRMGGRTYLQTEQEPVGGQGRGRGRGRWFSGGVATTPPPPGGLLAGPQLLTPSLNSEPPRRLAVLSLISFMHPVSLWFCVHFTTFRFHDSEEDEAERFKKTKRKLEKMLRQVSLSLCSTQLSCFPLPLSLPPFLSPFFLSLPPLPLCLSLSVPF